VTSTVENRVPRPPDAQRNSLGVKAVVKVADSYVAFESGEVIKLDGVPPTRYTGELLPDCC
jgi:hypothetical protein